VNGQCDVLTSNEQVFGRVNHKKEGKKRLRENKIYELIREQRREGTRKPELARQPIAVNFAVIRSACQKSAG
jgi:hypothetical protein